MGVLPWSHHALGDLVDAPEGAPATYTNYWGYEIELLKSIAGALNFRYDDIYVNILPTKVSRYKLSNVEDGKWGHIEAGPSGKEWNGMVAQVKGNDANTLLKLYFPGCLGRCGLCHL